MPVKRPRQRPIRPPLTPEQREALAHRASYHGSKEHKATRWWGGLPGARMGSDGDSRPRPKKQRTTICPLTSVDDRIQAEQWIQAAIRQGQYEFTESDQDFPKH